MAARPAKEKDEADADDKYSGYNDLDDFGLGGGIGIGGTMLDDREALALDPVFQEAVKTTRRVPTAAAAKPLTGAAALAAAATASVSTRRVAAPAFLAPLPFGGGGRPSAANGPPTAIGVRPMSAIRAAGFTAGGSNRAGGNVRGGPPSGVGGSGGGGGIGGASGPAPPLEKNDDNALPEVKKLRELERLINSDLDASCLANAAGDLRLALEKAKEAGRKHRSYMRQTLVYVNPAMSSGGGGYFCAGGGSTVGGGGAVEHDPATTYSITSEVDLAFSVLFNLGNQYAANRMYSEALRMYDMIVRNKVFAKAGRLRVNIGNIHFEQGNYHKAIRVYKMALDQVDAGCRRLRAKIAKNIAVCQFRLRKYADAFGTLREIGAVDPNVRSAFNMVLCSHIVGQVETAKAAFEELLKVRDCVNDSRGSMSL